MALVRREDRAEAAIRSLLPVDSELVQPLEIEHPRCDHPRTVAADQDRQPGRNATDDGEIDVSVPFEIERGDAARRFDSKRRT